MTKADWTPSWPETEKEALENFRGLLRLKTVNPPGNEIIACRFLEKILADEGIESAVIETGEGRANIVARLKGKRSDNALLLTSHTDVVPVEEEKWDFPPFGGEIANGMLYGRGAIDMKNMTILGLTTLILLKRLNVPLNRDVAFIAVADEEDGFEFGSQYMVEKRPELLEGEYALNELGAFTMHLNGRRVYPIQVAEKGYVWIRLTAKGEPGHGSLPTKTNAVVKLARAVRRLDRAILPLRPSPQAKEFIKIVAGILPPHKAVGLRNTLNPLASDFLFKNVMGDTPEARVFNALLHNTVTPTGLEAGQKANVIPSEAHAMLDGRILPGCTEEDLLKEIRAVIGKGYELEITTSCPGTSFDYRTPLYDTLKKSIEKNDPGCIVAPYMISGSTDACHYSRLGIKTYGFTPIKLPEGLDFMQLFHGHNERIPVDGFAWGLRTFYEAVLDFVADA